MELAELLFDDATFEPDGKVGRSAAVGEAVRAQCVLGAVERALARLDARERNYVHGMKRKERCALLRTLNVAPGGRKRRRAGAEESVPLRIQVLQSSLPEQVRLQLFEELKTPHVSDKKLEWMRRVIHLPLDRPCAPSYAHDSVRSALKEARALMEQVATGFDDVKTEVLKLVYQQAMGGASAYSLGIEGPPGTGKTHFVTNAVPRALQRPLVSIQLGGASDVSVLIGMMYTYEGSKEGRLASGLLETGCCNPIFYFDEVDKISETERGREIENVLIHLVDPTANHAIRDRYFHGIDLDFSRCTFIFSYNDARRVSPILLDRIRSFRISAPTLEQRADILRRHIVPRVTSRYRAPVVLPDDCVRVVAKMSESCAEGMRMAERMVEDVVSLHHLRVLDEVEGTEGGDEGSVSLRFVQQTLSKYATPRPSHAMYT